MGQPGGGPPLPAACPRPSALEDNAQSTMQTPGEEPRMARVLITGSSDGLGLMAGELLAGEGHEVTLHARNEARAGDARVALPAAAHLVVGDLASIRGMREVAEQASKLGRYDAVIHNAGVGYREPRRLQTPD